MEIASFLVKAKKNTYASGKKPTILDDGFEEFIYEENGYKYRDRYRAQDPKPFGGEEVVWHNGTAVWIMNYYAYGISEDMDSEKVYEFLRKAMSLVSENNPFRGPLNLKEGDFEYKNETKGEINNFKGTEKIFFKGKEIYSLEYHGGNL